ncbi:hypothetical protein D3C76_1040190 [compost metagenome]
MAIPPVRAWPRYTGSLSKRAYWRNAPAKGWRGKWAGMLSGRPSATASPARALKPVSARKIDCQPVVLTSKPPSIGARIGANPITSINCEKTFAEPTASHLSLTTALEITIPAQPPSAWMNRAPISHSRLGAYAHANEAAVNSPTPISNGMRRPNRSATGP